MTTPTRPRFVVAGEALVDVVVSADGAREQRPGGSPLNVAVGLARLGVDTVLATELGDDGAGRLVEEHLRSSGVTLLDGSVVPGRRTSTATATLDGSGAAAYEFDLSWTWGPRTLPAGATGLHVGSLGTSLRPGRDSVVDLVGQAADAGVLVTFDPNVRPTLTPDREQVWRDTQEVAARSQVVKLSDEDLAFLCPGATASELAGELLPGGTELVVVTLGGEGARAFSRHASVEVGSREAELVDTVGAGDSFMAALVAVVLEHGLAGLDEGRLRGYVAAAHEAAMVTVSRRGADPPRLDELAAGWPHVS